MYLISDGLNLSCSIYFSARDEFRKINEPLYFNIFNFNMLFDASLRWKMQLTTNLSQRWKRVRTGSLVSRTNI